MSTQPIFKHGDLPTKHLFGERDYIPPKARDEEEIARRRELKRGVLIAEQQQQGTKVACFILDHLEQPEDIAFGSRILAASGFNTAYYSHARGTSYMRRVLHLPRPTRNPNRTVTTGSMLQDAQFNFCEAYYAAEKLTDAAAKTSLEHANAKVPFGRLVGNASIKLACVTLGDRIGQYDEAAAQRMVRQRYLDTVQDSRDLGADVGSAPSLAQLANPDSDLSVFWRREAPNGALQAYEIGIAEAA